MSNLIKPPAQVETYLRAFDQKMRTGVGVYPRGGESQIGVRQDSSAGGGGRPDASGRFRDRSGRPGCGTDPVSTNYGGLCVCGPDECEYDPSVFCGWSALPFSSHKVQGAAPLTGPIPAAFGGVRTIRITAERACLFRIRGLWMRVFDSVDCTVTGQGLLANVLINEVPRLVETGGIAVDRRIGIPSSMFDSTFWVLPVDWGILSPINNNSQPMQLEFTTPCANPQHVVGVLFGDPIVNGKSIYGNTMYFV